MLARGFLFSKYFLKQSMYLVLFLEATLKKR